MLLDLVLSCVVHYCNFRKHRCIDLDICGYLSLQTGVELPNKVIKRHDCLPCSLLLLAAVRNVRRDLFSPVKFLLWAHERQSDLREVLGDECLVSLSRLRYI